jgi:chlorobactene glucosyltransferase
MSRLLLLFDCLVSLAMLPLIRSAWHLQRALLQVPALEPDGKDGPLVSIIVPARNEARVIERCVGSLLAQRYPNFEVIVVDDRSTDGTGEILAGLAAHNSRLRVTTGRPLPNGWVGKCWALHQGSQMATGEWLLFVDADTRHRPNMLMSVLAYAQQHNVDLLSLGPHQELGTFWERALLPAIFGIIVSAGGSLADVNDPRRAEAKANGQFMLFRASTYRTLGGHESVRNEIVDDFALARRVKGTGHRLLLAYGADLVATRMYHSFAEIWEGFSKNSYFEARRHVGGVLAGILLPWGLVIVPAALLARSLARLGADAAGSPLERAMLLQSAVQCGALVAFSLKLMQLMRLPKRWAVAVPPALLAFSVLMLTSTARVMSGRGVTWKGRRYDRSSLN